ncbi:2-keto-3-deoxygluconate kinase [Alkalibacterium subtropicum]|uniref:2-keto-3-deoxygluconate kinase n=1 Tax=Alkalibacterium subtropicum TaxID=753702 RepID=A0A1I1FH26_9LACT|nr:sugar kinase [Alkalibacterium subtropicum]SFB96988.1 2-keto-3-deoxygluconate kinase [Alkalibacterium subtropicum]
MASVVLIGEPMGLFRAQEYGAVKDVSRFTRSVAGAELNVGIGLSRLDHKVKYVTKLGVDPIGEHIVDYLNNEGMDTSSVLFSDNHETGLMLKNKVSDGDPVTAYYRRYSAFTTLSVEEIKNLDVESIELLHITGIPPAVSFSVREAIFYLMKKAKEAGTFITFDPNIRPSIWESEKTMISVLNELASYADVVLPGIAEGKLLMGSDDVEEIAQFYLDQGAQVVITKSGAHGAYVTEKGKETVNVKGFKVDKVVDTVGAGDGFAVGVIHAYLNGRSWTDAAIYANAIGSLQVQHSGDNEGLPTRSRLESYIANYS